MEDKHTRIWIGVHLAVVALTVVFTFGLISNVTFSGAVLAYVLAVATKMFVDEFNRRERASR